MKLKTSKGFSSFHAKLGITRHPLYHLEPRTRRLIFLGRLKSVSILSSIKVDLIMTSTLATLNVSPVIKIHAGLFVFHFIIIIKSCSVSLSLSVLRLGLYIIRTTLYTLSNLGGMNKQASYEEQTWYLSYRVRWHAVSGRRSWKAVIVLVVHMKSDRNSCVSNEKERAWKRSSNPAYFLTSAQLANRSVKSV